LNEEDSVADVQQLAVIGAGTMGHSIAQLGAMSGFETRVFDVSADALARGEVSVKGSLEKLASKERISRETQAAAQERLSFTSDLPAALDGVGIVIEAVPEILELKQQTFAEIEKYVGADVLLASNTSQLSITAIASATSHPERVIGMHFFNPAVLMKLVEIIRGVRTTDEVLSRTVALSDALGKESVVCQRDTPGFITTRAIMALRLECIRIYEEGIATIEDIDKALRLAFNHPMGQFELNDMNGLDVALHGARNLRDAYGERFAPPASLVARNLAGDLGRKTGRGWYTYDADA
jgi:3-hydroxybutyryl-CoA dehydrogenase